jgi:DNA-directed RNA polymerase specialized sigma24 family protein
VGDSPDQPPEWPDDDDIDWVRLYALAPNLWRSYLSDLEERPSPAELARFTDRCIRSIRCLTDLHTRLPGLGLSLAEFADLHARAWNAQFQARADDDNREDRPVADDETVLERRSATRSVDWPADLPTDLRDVLADEMREAVINLHVRGLDHDQIACAMDIPREWPAFIVSKAGLHPQARAVVLAHLEGKSLGAIAKATKVPATTALRILRRIGETPNGTKVRVDAKARARTIVKLRTRGLTYKEIAARVGCDLDDVKNALRRDRRHRYGGGHVSE